MGEIYDLIPLIKIYLILNVVFMIVMFAVLIIYAIKLLIDYRKHLKENSYEYFINEN